MSLLLKSLKQIDWRPAESPPEEELAQHADPAPTIEMPPQEPQFSLCESDSPVAEPPAAEETVLRAEQLNNALLDLDSEAQAPPGLLEGVPEIELGQAPEAPAEPPKEPEIQTAESTLDRLNELHQLIDAALEEYSQNQPFVVQPAEADFSLSPPAIASEQLEKEESAVEFSPVDASPATVVPAPVIPMPSIPVPVVPMPAAPSIASPLAPAVKIRNEYRELCHHLLARYRLDEPSTILAVDAGRVTNDASWLAPFAACLLETLSKEPRLHLSAPPKILLVEAAGPECGIARHLGLDCPEGLADVLRGKCQWASAIQPTYHPQIDLLSRGKALLQTHQSAQFVSVWTDLQRRYQAILVAAGPWEAPSQASWRKTGMATAAMLLPLADAAVVCVELEGTPQSVAVETKQALERRGVRLLGCVVRGQ